MDEHLLAIARGQIEPDEKPRNEVDEDPFGGLIPILEEETSTIKSPVSWLELDEEPEPFSDVERID